MASPNGKEKKSYLSYHPQIRKKLPQQFESISKLQIPTLEYNRIHKQLSYKQEQTGRQLQQKIFNLQQQNKIFQESMSYYNPELTRRQLQNQLSDIKQQDDKITRFIEQCQLIQSNTTPQEYFLFKKNKRLQSFNQAMDQLYEQVNRQREDMKKFLQEIKQQQQRIKKDIISMEKQLKEHDNKQFQQKNVLNSIELHSPIRKNNNEEKQEESRVDFSIQQNQSETQKHNFEKQKIPPSESDSGSSIDYDQLNQCKEEYKNLIETYEILSQNKQIMTTQLLNNIQSIEDSLNNFYEIQKTKLFRDITQIKQDFEYIPSQQLLTPTQQQLQYQIKPLIEDYKKKLSQISQKLPSDLRNISLQLLSPLAWQNVNFEEYLQISNPIKTRRSTKKSIMSANQMQKENKKLKQSQREYEKLEVQLSKQDEQIKNLEYTLQETMSQTMMFKQRQHELQLAMNNMKKMIRKQQQQL